MYTRSIAAALLGAAALSSAIPLNARQDSPPSIPTTSSKVPAPTPTANASSNVNAQNGGSTSGSSSNNYGMNSYAAPSSSNSPGQSGGWGTGSNGSPPPTSYSGSSSQWGTGSGSCNGDSCGSESSPSYSGSSSQPPSSGTGSGSCNGGSCGSQNSPNLIPASELSQFFIGNMTSNVGIQDGIADGRDGITTALVTFNIDSKYQNKMCTVVFNAAKGKSTSQKSQDDSKDPGSVTVFSSSQPAQQGDTSNHRNQPVGNLVVGVSDQQDVLSQPVLGNGPNGKMPCSQLIGKPVGFEYVPDDQSILTWDFTDPKNGPAIQITEN